ncbi:aspartate--tRNA ligase [Candidatus Nomurabacteria bacterium CG_4_9_14_0_2_um_filter_32_10]|uniref:Aspartate--tRNA ligase n=2 Tax=Candidatus Nomuraibacteriota TaxID=1752729 RepID=A0A2J0MEQ1_9BACT|nr:MAG: aspartate--tRNA ligase [Candidatus Nomurabacteria bacterium CG_4_10_14_0_2_um_filter_33_9]PJC49429.1 MAG: aspartate--tRNA ligase [Candidatus Nomurabacteria bacterium CG_4_9_14_0_2_um_filter_32_10]
MKDRIYIKDLKENIGKEVIVAGWVNIRRDQGKMVFFDMRDMTGLVQCVALPSRIDVIEKAKEIRPEWVLKLTGLVNKRPDKNIKMDVLNGELELEVTNVEILNKAETTPFQINENSIGVNEDLRMKYKYLDLRTERMQKNIRMRDKIISFFRDYMHKNDFIEIETPILMKGTPEGSREYVVPSRLFSGQFYVLPQSPQQFKQLCMVAGFEKYFQVARCMRDEDTRGDRQPEFTQLDFEMSFVTQEEVLEYTEAMFIELVKNVYPEKKINKIPFPRISYKESIEKYGSDKPDLRVDKNDPNELAFVWILDFPMFEKNDEGELQAVHHPFCSIKDEDKEKFLKGEDLFSIRANAYDLVLNGYELSSGSIRIHEKEIQKQVFKLLNIGEEEQKKKFGHMLEAFTYGAPPHGGFAPGIDRIVMILQNEPNIREVIAFPKTGEGKDLMMGSPAEISEKQLKELGIKLSK